MCESLLQSHVPGHLVLLPSLAHAMAVQGGSVEGLRARGNAIVSISWHGSRKVKDTKSASSGGGNRTRGGSGCVHKATITFQSQHIWFSPPDSGSGGEGSIIEDRAGFFSFRSAGKGKRVEENAAGIRHPAAQVIIVYPAGKRQLRLISSHLQPYGEGGKVDQNQNRNSSRPGSEHPECARSIASQSIISSDDITIAANPNKHLNRSPVDVGKTSGTGQVHPDPPRQSRRGIGIQIFEFPCKITLKS